MKKHFRTLLLSAVAISAFAACQEKPRNTEELVDPWLRERTPVNVRLEAQIGPAIISSDWRTDDIGSVIVSLVTPDIDLSAVKVVALDFAYPESEFCPTADLKPGDLIDLTDGFEEFTVTAKTGETRTYTITYTDFKDPFEGIYCFTPVGGIIDTAHSYKCGFVMIGGYKNNPVAAQIMDKYWQWCNGYDPRHEDDNVISVRLDRADDQTGFTYGTIVNTSGVDGKYADYIWNADEKYGANNDKPAPKYDMNSKYRIIPTGKSRWSKLGDGKVNIHAYEDVDYKNPLYSFDLLSAGEYQFWEEEDVKKKSIITVQELAFHRSFGEGPFEDYTEIVDEWIFITNIRNIFWLVKQDYNSAFVNHDAFLKSDDWTELTLEFPNE